MTHHELGPDADAVPLSTEERATFEALVSQVSRTSRLKAQMLTVSPARPLVRGVASLVFCAALVIGCAVLAPLSLWAALGCWLLLLVVCLRSAPRWKAMVSGASARIRSILDGP